MGYIIDMSKFQKTSAINWDVFSKNIDLLILRVQYGSLTPDTEYANHVANAKKYNIPFNTYTFPAFSSVSDSRVEARDAAKRQDKDSKMMWVDIESEYDANKQPKGITKLSQSVRLEGIKAYVDELRKQGVKKVGAYVAHNVYKAWAIDTIIGIFDAVWIPRYGSNNGQQQVKPDFPCDLWQYSSVGKKDGYNGNLDVNVLIGSKPLSYFTGGVVTQQAVETKIIPKEEIDMLEKAIVIGGYPDFPMAELVALTLHAPIYFRSAIPAGKIAKEVYVVGGSVDGIQADKVINLTGADRFAVVEQVKKFLGK